MEQELRSKINLASCVKRIGWAYIFIYLQINLGSLDILPSWIGYILILNALWYVADYEPSAMLLKNLCHILIVWNFLAWIAKLLGITAYTFGLQFSSLINIISIVISIISLYFHFQLITNLADVADKIDMHERKDILLKLRTINTILQTVFSAFILFYEIKILLVFAVLIIADVIVTLRITFCLMAFSRQIACQENIQI